MIDTEKYKLSEDNYHNIKFKKTQIVIGHNGRKDMRHYNSWLNRLNGKYKKTSTFTIDTDGKVYQHFDPSYYSDFLGIDQDKSNISILLVNQGWLDLDTDYNIYRDWLGHAYSRNTQNVINKSWRGHDTWVKYTNEQYDSLKKLLIKLCDEFEIKKECIGNNVYDENVDIYNGITFKSNYSQDIKDVSPAFEMDQLKDL